jgi:hypothetical protein
LLACLSKKEEKNELQFRSTDKDKLKTNEAFENPAKERGYETNPIFSTDA